MIKQEVVDELRIAMYEDIGLLHDFYTDRWRPDALRDAQEYVPGITEEEIKEYCTQDAPYVKALLKLVINVADDEAALNSLFDESPEKAYETVKKITGDAIPYEDFIDILEYGGKPFFKAFEGASTGDELSESDLELVAGGSDEERAEGEIIKIIEKIVIKTVSCFTADSPVATPTGAKAIKDIKKGDVVYSLDSDGNRVQAEVKDTTSGEAAVIEVHFDNGKVWNTTSTQWFYDGKTFRNIWQHNGRDIVTLDGVTKVTEIIETGRKENVYDFVIGGSNVMFINSIAAEGFGT